MSTVTMTFVQVPFVLASFVHIRNTAAVTDTILTRQFFGGLNFFGPYIFLDPKIFSDPNFWAQKIFQAQNFLDPKFFWTKKYFGQTKILSQNSLRSNFFELTICMTKHFFGFHYFGIEIFWDNILSNFFGRNRSETEMSITSKTPMTNSRLFKTALRVFQSCFRVIKYSFKTT